MHVPRGGRRRSVKTNASQLWQLLDPFWSFQNPYLFIYLKPKIGTTFRCALPPFLPCHQSAPESLITDYAPPERVTYFRLQVYQMVGISSAYVYERGGKSVSWVSV